jgi:hypothetical protein
MGLGCAITDYETITDNDQVSSGKEGHFDPYNTNGKAHLMTGQVATIWPDGSDELINFVDQKANGDRTMTLYNNFNSDYPTNQAAGEKPTFHDDNYCNPDWSGCAIWTAHDPPGNVFSPAFDGTWNQNCSGSRSLSVLVATTRYYGECGRTEWTLQDRMQLAMMGEPGDFLGRPGMWFHYDYNNLTLLVNGHAMPVFDGAIHAVPKQKQFVALFDNPLNPVTLNAMSDVAGKGDIVDISIGYNGFWRTMTVKLNQDPQDQKFHF